MRKAWKEMRFSKKVVLACVGFLMLASAIAFALYYLRRIEPPQALLPSWATSVLVGMADMYVRWAESAYGAATGSERFNIVLCKLEAYLKGVGIAIDRHHPRGRRGGLGEDEHRADCRLHQGGGGKCRVR